MKTQKMKGIMGLLALSLVMFIVTLDTTITNIALPTITDYFHTSLTTTNWVSTVYVLVLSVFIIPASKLADQFGRKKVMLIGLVTFGLGSALCGMSQSIVFLILMRILQGLGGAIVTPVMIPLSVEAFGREKAGKAVGIIGAVTAIAAAGGPPIGGLIIKYLNWQSIFYVNVPIVIITFILICINFSESYDNTISKRVDWFGMIFLSSGLFQLTFVLIKGYTYGWTSRPIVLLIIGAVASLTLFAVVEKKMKEPLIEFGLFREITFAASTIGYFICGFAIVCSSLIFNYFLQNVRGFTALNSAYIIMWMSITVIISMPLGSILAKKIGYRAIIFPGILLMSISMFMLYRLKIDTSTPVMVLDMIVLGFGFGLTCQSLVSACKFIPQTKAGIASGIVNAARQMGTCLGIALLVGMMTHNVDIAKTSIENTAIANINSANISDSVKTVMIRDIKESFKNSSDNDNASTSDLQSTLKKDVTDALSSVSSSPQPSDNETLGKLYDGISTLNDGATKASDGQKTLNDGIKSLSTNLESYVLAVNSTYYLMIKNDPAAAQLLAGYKTSLTQVQATYTAASEANKEKYKQQIQVLSNLVTLYTAGTDSMVTNEEQFETKIASLAQQSEDNQNVVSSGNKIISGASQLLEGSNQLVDANAKIEDGTVQIASGVGLAGQESEILDITDQLRDDKNDQVTGAFNKTFLFAAIILLLTSVCGLFTDRKGEPNVVKAEYEDNVQI